MRDIKWYLSFDLQKLSWLCNANQTPMKIFIIILVRWNVTLEQMEVRLSVLKYLSTVFTSITSYINDKIKFSCEQYCLLATFGLCVDGLYGGGMEWGIGGS